MPAFTMRAPAPRPLLTQRPASSSLDCWRRRTIWRESRTRGAKYLALLREVVPKLSRVGVLGQVASQVGFAELEAASVPAFRRLAAELGYRRPARLG